jgi:hypothetical protein
MCATLQTVSDGLVGREVKCEAFGMQVMLCCSVVGEPNHTSLVGLQYWISAFMRAHIPHTRLSAQRRQEQNTRTHIHTCYAMLTHATMPTQSHPATIKSNTPIR